jgi:import inner membrane translocase subunit TIM22
LVKQKNSKILTNNPKTKQKGFGIGAFFSLMSASFAYEDPYLRAQTQVGMSTTRKASQIFKEMGKGMWTSGKSFGKIGALFAGIECVIEGVRVSFLSSVFLASSLSFIYFSTVLKMISTTLLEQDS